MEQDDDFSDRFSGPKEGSVSPEKEEGRSNSEGEGNSSLARDSPLAMIQKDNKAIYRTRLLVVFLLALAALGTSFFVFYSFRASEQDSFETDFVAVAERLVESFLADVGRRMSQASTLAAGVTMAMRAYDTPIYNLTIDNDVWARITNDAQSIGLSPLVAYSPYLRTDEERRVFEANAAGQDSTISDTGSNPPCFLCGEGITKVLNPDNLFEFPGTGKFRCGDVLLAALTGNIPEGFCEVTKITFLESCDCDTSAVDSPSESSVDDFEGWSNADGLFRMDGSEPVKQEFRNAPYAPMWQADSSISSYPPNLYDQNTEEIRKEAIRQAIEGKTAVFSKLVQRQDDPFYENFGGLNDRISLATYFPIFEGNASDPVGVAVMDAMIENLFTTILPSRSSLVLAVISNSCGESITIQPGEEGRTVSVIGLGDLHDASYDKDGLQRESTFAEFDDYVQAINGDAQEIPTEQLEYCRYRISVHPTSEFEQYHETIKPYVYAAVTFAIFIFTTIVFGVYDFLIRKRQAKVLQSAIRTNDIVTSLFPTQQVRDRLYEEAQARSNEGGGKGRGSQDFNGGHSGGGERVIADLFPHASIVFFDLQGFTAWSSEREPEQVFRLLESLYGAFDEVARKLGVFKVETIGDSYVAACGLPKERDDHAVVIVRFADECFRRMGRVTHDLEKYLGPSTAELKARCGIHSGPVTAGVLRGEKARFQLFGDSINTAARMESTGLPERIHISPSTADELRRQGKEHWLMERQDTVVLKGKGHMQTYWALPRNKAGLSSTHTVFTGSEQSSSDDPLEAPRAPTIAEKQNRLIEWSVEVLIQHLQPVVNSRSHQAPTNMEDLKVMEEDFLDSQKDIVVAEMTSILSMPRFDPSVAQAINREIKISDKAKNQLRQYVHMIASTYRDTPFHNFLHANHVMLSAGKLMKRIMSPERIKCKEDGPVALAEEMYNSTYGLSADPLTLFAVVFASLIHDVDHTGLTNAELIAKGEPLCVLYRKKSVAEQNSVDLAWEMLMSDQFPDLRACIYTNKEEFLRFRQLLVNITMATDIADKEFQQQRKARWAEAFDKDASGSSSEIKDLEVGDETIDMHRKATIVLEHIIQASDVAHTMQHWHVYIKYNRLLFEERYLAWLQGVANEPSAGWYKGEIGFFDFYIIPLARKLDKCGVFGVSYHEYVQYALSNRAEWEEKGTDIVASMLADCQAKYGASPSSLKVAK